jgi:hypothetical protein
VREREGEAAEYASRNSRNSNARSAPPPGADETVETVEAATASLIAAHKWGSTFKDPSMTLRSEAPLRDGFGGVLKAVMGVGCGKECSKVGCGLVKSVVQRWWGGVLGCRECRFCTRAVIIWHTDPSVYLNRCDIWFSLRLTA